jgi:hypothetical protein
LIVPLLVSVCPAETVSVALSLPVFDLRERKPPRSKTKARSTSTWGRAGSSVAPVAAAPDRVAQGAKWWQEGTRVAGAMSPASQDSHAEGPIGTHDLLRSIAGSLKRDGRV